MQGILRRAKKCLPNEARARLRRFVASIPLARRLAGVQLCPWRVSSVIGGTMKGGTTALSSFLGQHPEICMTRGKEAHFFDCDHLFPADRPPNYDAYHRLFTPTVDTRMLVDATPIYMYWEAAPPRVMAYHPGMKWVLLLRQPAERAYAHWNMIRQLGNEPLDFVSALEQESARRALSGRPDRAYTDRGFYARQLRRLFAIVPRQQVLVLRSEELRHDHQATLRRVFAFLGVDPGVRIEPAIIHARSYDVPLPAAIKRTLTERFAADIRDLELLLGWDLKQWRQM